MRGKREADNNFNFNFKSEKLDELRSRVDAAFDEHGDEAWEQIKGIFTCLLYTSPSPRDS